MDGRWPRDEETAQFEAVLLPSGSTWLPRVIFFGGIWEQYMPEADVPFSRKS